MEEPIQSQEETALEMHRRHVALMKTTYPGLRRWVHMQRYQETGETLILFFDMDVNPDEPLYAVALHPRDLLIVGQGMSTPALSFGEFVHMLETGERPAGYLRNNYPPVEMTADEPNAP